MEGVTSASRVAALIRHGAAEPGGEGADHDRALTAAGRSAARAAGEWLATVLPAPELVCCSSALRAQQTWAELGAALTPGELRIERELYLAGPRDVVARVTDPAASSVVVVGHNPTLEQALVMITGAMHGMRAGAVALVDVDARRLLELWEPSD